jgi:hypothetical protein
MTTNLQHAENSEKRINENNSTVIISANDQ